jgi:hypothetical protein
MYLKYTVKDDWAVYEQVPEFTRKDLPKEDLDKEIYTSSKLREKLNLIFVFGSDNLWPTYGYYNGTFTKGTIEEISLKDIESLKVALL